MILYQKQNVILLNNIINNLSLLSHLFCLLYPYILTHIKRSYSASLRKIHSSFNFFLSVLSITSTLRYCDRVGFLAYKTTTPPRASSFALRVTIAQSNPRDSSRKFASSHERSRRRRPFFRKTQPNHTVPRGIKGDARVIRIELALLLSISLFLLETQNFP